MNKIEINSGVALIKILDCYFLVANREARKKCSYIRQISETGAFVWRLLSDGKNGNEIFSMLKEEYNIPNSIDINRDLALFIENLEKCNYLAGEDSNE